MLLLANIVRTVAAVVVGIIVIAIILVVLGANQSNDIVNWIHDAGAWLVGPFKGLFDIDNADVRMLVNWGLAAIVYLAIGRYLQRLLAPRPPR